MRHGETFRGHSDLHPHDHVDRMGPDPRPEPGGRAATAVAAPHHDAERPGPDTGPVVVGVDGTPASTAALAWAVHHAGDAPVVAVTVWQEPLQTSPVGARGRDRRRDDAQRLLDEAMAAARAPDGVERHVDRGSAGPVLVERARDARLLVLGNHRRGALGAAGSVSLECLHHARCPVVLVPAG